MSIIKFKKPNNSIKRIKLKKAVLSAERVSKVENYLEIEVKVFSFKYT